MAISKIESAALASGVPSRSQLPAGTVLQVVNATYSTVITSTTSTFADTGLTATITPTSTTSKILVIFYQNGCAKTAGNTYIQLRLLRNSSVILNVEDGAGYTNDTSSSWFGSIGTSYLDSPSTTSATTYKTQFASGANIPSVLVQGDQPNSTSTMILMEIAA